MIEVLIVLLVLGTLYMVSGIHDEVVTWWHRRQIDRVQAELRSAQSAVDNEFRRARRDMNDAVGQSWRNLADGDRG